MLLDSVGEELEVDFATAIGRLGSVLYLCSFIVFLYVLVPFNLIGRNFYPIVEHPTFYLYSILIAPTKTNSLVATPRRRTSDDNNHQSFFEYFVKLPAVSPDPCASCF